MRFAEKGERLSLAWRGLQGEGTVLEFGLARERWRKNLEQVRTLRSLSLAARSEESVRYLNRFDTTGVA